MFWLRGSLAIAVLFLTRLTLNQNIKINFNSTNKLANYNKRTYGYCREAIEIKNNREAYNDTEHFSLDQEWQQIVKKRIMRGGRKRENKTDRNDRMRHEFN